METVFKELSFLFPQSKGQRHGRPLAPSGGEYLIATQASGEGLDSQGTVLIGL